MVARAEGEAPFAGVEKTGPNIAALKDIQAIMDILPHRCAGRRRRAAPSATARPPLASPALSPKRLCCLL